MRPLLLLLAAAAFVAAGAPADAQILKIRFKDDKAAKKYQKHTCEIGGEVVLLGEAVPDGGIRLIYANGRPKQIQYKPDVENDLFVLDPGDPSQVPYKLEGGVPVATRKTSIVGVNGKYVQSISFFLPGETIETVAREYRLRKDRIAEIQEQRDRETKGGAAWFDRHARLLAAYERLLIWLESNSFEGAAKEVRRAFDKEARDGAEDARRLRAKQALDSPTVVGTNDALDDAAREAGGDRHSFHVAESRHVRLTYVTQRVADERALELLVFAEKVIEGFRTQFVDPYVGESFPNRIPEGLFLQLYFGPEEASFHEAFLPAYYGISWGDEATRKRRLESAGNRFVLSVEPRILQAWRLPEREDFEGIVAHALGHALADHHFNGGPDRMEQAWIGEGVGYYISFEFLGRNSVTCKEFRKSNYVREEKEGSKEPVMGYRDVMTAVALEQGQRIDRVMLKTLSEMDDADLAKSWSFLDYVARTSEREGQLWLRAACEHARNRATFLESLRPVLNQMFGVSGQDVYKVLDDRWRVQAEAERVRGT